LSSLPAGLPIGPRRGRKAGGRSRPFRPIRPILPFTANYCPFPPFPAWGQGSGIGIDSFSFLSFVFAFAFAFSFPLYESFFLWIPHFFLKNPPVFRGFPGGRFLIARGEEFNTHFNLLRLKNKDFRVGKSKASTCSSPYSQCNFYLRSCNFYLGSFAIFT
jgi:hypothetical protein